MIVSKCFNYLRGGQNYKSDYLTLKNTINLRGIFSLVIIIHHSRARTEVLNDTIIGSILTAVGYLVVGMFFFLSGYGIRESMTSKEKYRETFFKRRIVPYYADYLVFTVIYLLYSLVVGEKINIITLIKAVIWKENYIYNGWYLNIALIMYLSFQVAFILKKWLKEEKILLIIFVVYCCVCMMTEQSIIFIQSIFGLPMGYCWSVKKKDIDKIINKHFILCFFCSFVLFDFTLIVGNWYTVGFLQLVVRAISVCFFDFFVICCLMIVQIQNKFTTFLGNISLELYVIHGIWVEIFDQKIVSLFGVCSYFIKVIICSVTSAWLLHKAIIKLNCALRKFDEKS